MGSQGSGFQARHPSSAARASNNAPIRDAVGDGRLLTHAGLEDHDVVALEGAGDEGATQAGRGLAHDKWKTLEGLEELQMAANFLPSFATRRRGTVLTGQQTSRDSSADAVQKHISNNT